MQNLVLNLKSLLKNKFLQNINVILIENIVSKGINFVIILLLTRLLTPDIYGKYSFISVFVIASATIFDFGMDNTSIRFAAKEKKYNKSVFGLYFLVKAMFAVFIAAIIYLFAASIFTKIGKPEIIEFIPFLIFGAIGEYFLLVNDAYFQSVERFKFRAFVNISRYILALIYVVILYFLGKFSLNLILYIYFIPLIICLAFTFNYVTFVKSLMSNFLPKNILKDIFNYEKWMFFLSIANTLLIRIDIIMLSIWVGFDKIGIYNAAFQLACVVSLLPMAVEKVMLPKLSGLNKGNIIFFTKKSFKTIFILALIILLFIPLTWFIPGLIYGKQYNEAGLVLQILLIGFLLSFILLPLDQAFFAFGKPKFNTLSKYLQLFMIIILNILTIPTLGYIWAAINVVIARLVYALILGIFFIKEINKYSHIKK